PGDRERCLTIIEDESVRLSKLSDNLLKLAALEAQNMHFAPRAYRLDRQIRTVLLACEPQWSAKSLDVDIALDELSVTADADLLSQVWMNLLGNSIKFTPEGGSVRVELHRRLSEVVFRITDTGIGIAECDQAHIFERFFKADLARDRSQGGSGLGLAIAQKIVALHNGTIGVVSALGMGTTFTVSLPAE
ncbi:histidine kinase, partial [Kouleothrix aurantiaca]